MFLWGSLLGLSACSPNVKQLRDQYPHVLYKGPKEQADIVIKKAAPEFWTPISQISKAAQHAILMSEDAAFYSHPGYDANQMKEAFEESLHAGKLKRGASTITQQVVRNIYLSQEKSLVRKARELWIATKLEKAVSKKRIFELYLNIAEWGAGTYGIGKASRLYFNKHPSELSAKEGAFLAMLLPSPKKYSVSFRKRELTPYARKTVRTILRKMVAAGFLTAEQMTTNWNQSLSFEKNSVVPNQPDDDNLEDEDVVIEE